MAVSVGWACWLQKSEQQPRREPPPSGQTDTGDSKPAPAIPNLPGMTPRAPRLVMEMDDDALRKEKERRTSAEWRQRGAGSTSSNSPKSPVTLAPLDGVFGVDIGGTLAKLVFLGEPLHCASPSEHSAPICRWSVSVKLLGSRTCLRFVLRREDQSRRLGR